jgi:hypothetical protein
MLTMESSQNYPERRLRRGKTPGTPARRRREFRPWYEDLEDRTVLSTLMVLNNLDNGAGSLRDTIAAASSGDTIRFAGQLKGQTITLTSAELAITKRLDIEGLGADNLTLSGNHSSRVFDVTGGVTATIADLTITIGLADHGGGILNEAGASLTLSDVTLFNNQATGGLGGGAIFNDAGASLSITDSSLTNNQASTTVSFDPSTGGGGGGAIFNQLGASLTVADCKLSGNQAITTAGFDNFGGAIYNLGGTASISDSALENNRVSGGASFSFGGSGGGAVENGEGATLTVTDSRFTDNQAICAGGDPFFVGVGGALDDEFGSVATISSSQFSENDALGNSGGASGAGGAIENGVGGASSTLSVSGSTFISNQALGGGDGGDAFGGAIDASNGVVSVADSTCHDNQAIGGDGGTVSDNNPFVGIGAGGGISNSASLTVEQGTFTGNQARGGNGAIGGSGTSLYVTDAGLGGGVSQAAASATAVVDGSTFAGNQALGGSNATGGASGQGFIGGGAGGGLFVHGAANVTNSTFDHNQAMGGSDNTGSSTVIEIGVGRGGGIALSGVTAPGSTLAAVNLTLTHNLAEGGAGNSNGLLVGIGLGGGFAGFLQTIAMVSNSIIDHNQAIGGREDDDANGSDGLGGGSANLLGSTLEISNCTVDHNRALGGEGEDGDNGGNGFGGGIYNDGSSTFGVSSLTVTGSTITHNDADEGAAGAGGSDGQGIGGGLYLAAGGIVCLDVFTQIHVKHNHASTSNDDIFGSFTTC